MALHNDAEGSDTARGYALIIAAATLWASIGPAVRFALEDGATAIEIAFLRAILACGIFAAHAAARGGFRLRRPDVVPVLGFGIVGIALFYGSNVVAVERGGAALASVLLYSAPAWVALASWAMTRHRPSIRTVGAVAVTMLGVGAVASSGPEGIRPDPVAVGWGLLASLCYALHYLFGARYFPRYEPGTLFVWILAIGAIGLGPFVRFGDKGPVAWSAILYVAALPTYVAYRLYAAGLPRVAPTRAATVASAEPVIAALFAWLTFGESLGAIGYLGAALVVVGVALSATGGSSRRQAGGREPR
jgi:DME family drug/metabolite transporter